MATESALTNPSPPLPQLALVRPNQSIPLTTAFEAKPDSAMRDSSTSSAPTFGTLFIFVDTGTASIPSRHGFEIPFNRTLSHQPPRAKQRNFRASGSPTSDNRLSHKANSLGFRDSTRRNPPGLLAAGSTPPRRSPSETLSCHAKTCPPHIRTFTASTLVW